MFNEAELAVCRKMAKMASVKSAEFPGFIYQGNPHQLNISWGNPSQTQFKLPPKPPMTFGRSIGEMGRGVAGQVGNATRMLFTGHHGQPGLLGNIYGGIQETAFGGRHSPRQLWNLGNGKVWAPVREALPEFEEAWGQTGAPGGYVADKATQAYHWIKRLLVDPRYYGRS